MSDLDPILKLLPSSDPAHYDPHFLKALERAFGSQEEQINYAAWVTQAAARYSFNVHPDSSDPALTTGPLEPVDLTLEFRLFTQRGLERPREHLPFDLPHTLVFSLYPPGPRVLKRVYGYGSGREQVYFRENKGPVYVIEDANGNPIEDGWNTQHIPNSQHPALERVQQGLPAHLKYEWQQSAQDALPRCRLQTATFCSQDQALEGPPDTTMPTYIIEFFYENGILCGATVSKPGVKALELYWPDALRELLSKQGWTLPAGWEQGDVQTWEEPNCGAQRQPAKRLAYPPLGEEGPLPSEQNFRVSPLTFFGLPDGPNAIVGMDANGNILREAWDLQSSAAWSRSNNRSPYDFQYEYYHIGGLLRCRLKQAKISGPGPVLDFQYDGKTGALKHIQLCSSDSQEIYSPKDFHAIAQYTRNLPHGWQRGDVQPWNEAHRLVRRRPPSRLSYPSVSPPMLFVPELPVQKPQLVTALEHAADGLEQRHWPRLAKQLRQLACAKSSVALGVATLATLALTTAAVIWNYHSQPEPIATSYTHLESGTAAGCDGEQPVIFGESQIACRNGTATISAPQWQGVYDNACQHARSTSASPDSLEKEATTTTFQWLCRRQGMEPPSF